MRYRTLEDVVRANLGPIVDVITQDEYTHDVIVQIDGGRFLVFDTT